MVLGSVLVSTLVLFSQSVFAQNSCVGLFSKVDSKATSDYGTLNWPTKVSLAPATLEQRVQYLVSSWKKMLAPVLKVPSSTISFNNIDYKNSFYSFKDNRIVLGVEAVSKNYKKSEVVFTHEFGHAVFVENFVFEKDGRRIRFAELIEQALIESKSLKANSEFSKLISEINEIEGVLSAAIKTGADEILIKDLKEMLENKKNKTYSFGKINQEFDYLNDALISYNELFADSFAVLMGRDPKAVSQTLDMSDVHALGALRYNLEYRGRNKEAKPSREFAINSFKDWQHEINDAYTLLDPARGVLWKLFMENLKSEEIPVFLKTFLDATAEHLVRRLNSGENLRVSAQESDPTTLNQEFVKIFVEKARKNQLPLRK